MCEPCLTHVLCGKNRTVLILDKCRWTIFYNLSGEGEGWGRGEGGGGIDGFLAIEEDYK